MCVFVYFINKFNAILINTMRFFREFDKVILKSWGRGRQIAIIIANIYCELAFFKNVADTPY